MSERWYVSSTSLDSNLDLDVVVVVCLPAEKAQEKAKLLQDIAAQCYKVDEFEPQTPVFSAVTSSEYDVASRDLRDLQSKYYEITGPQQSFAGTPGAYKEGQILEHIPEGNIKK